MFSVISAITITDQLNVKITSHRTMECEGVGMDLKDPLIAMI